MIIVNLKGGLGNQMFQYACGRALSMRQKTELKLDASNFAATLATDTPRRYLLSHFNIEEHIADAGEIRRLKYPYGIASKGWQFIKEKYIPELTVGWNPWIAAGKKNMYVNGFWQTGKYFEDIQDIIRRDFTLKKPFGKTAQSIVDRMADAGKTGVATVSLHIRRGDVERDKATNPYWGITTKKYYEEALNYLTVRQKNIHVFIFSDDITAARSLLSIPYPVTHVSMADIPDYEELVLMSMCRHTIIANSSFSWWGAWLNSNPEKIVIAPKEWITIRKLQHKDTVPSSWIRL